MCVCICVFICSYKHSNQGEVKGGLNANVSLWLDNLIGLAAIVCNSLYEKKKIVN